MYSGAVWDRLASIPPGSKKKLLLHVSLVDCLLPEALAKAPPGEAHEGMTRQMRVLASSPCFIR